jgi:ADP-ribose pyrophosphatase
MKRHGPWKIKKSEIKFRNHFLKLRVDEVIRPDGRPGTYSVVEVIPGVIVVPVDEKNNVYLAKEFQYGIGRESLKLVSGGIEPGSTPLETAKKELQEELGLVAKSWVRLGIINTLTSLSQAHSVIFLARNLSLTKRQTEPTETIKPIRMPLAKAVKLVLNNKIVDGGVGYALLLAYHKLNSKP